MYKEHVTVALITIGVSGFMLFEDHGSGNKSSSSSAGNSLWGLGLLLTNLLMDGATNSWQDQLFLKYRLKSQQLMMFMNLFSGLILALSLAFFTHFCNRPLLNYSLLLNFSEFPSALPDVLHFPLRCSRATFHFPHLEHFGSLSLVTITVTRKLFTILWVFFWFNHKVNAKQWSCVSLVFWHL